MKHLIVLVLAISTLITSCGSSASVETHAGQLKAKLQKTDTYWSSLSSRFELLDSSIYIKYVDSLIDKGELVRINGDQYRVISN